MALIEPDHLELSISRQCELLGVSRASFYYKPLPIDSYNDILMRLLDIQYVKTPFYGSRRLRACLSRIGHDVNRKRVSRLMRLMGIQAIYPKPKTSKGNKEHKIYPYLLKGLNIDRPDYVWATDITYIRMKKGFIYLMAIMDWYSRYIVSWALSITLETTFCIEALKKGLETGKPEIFNSDQGSQFTSNDFTGLLEKTGISISMDGRGRVFDNIFVERLWRTIKYEEVYLKDYSTVPEAVESLGVYIKFYNMQRLHQALGYRPPAEIYLRN